MYTSLTHTLRSWNVDAPISVRSCTANADSCDATEFSPDKREFIEQLTTTPYPNGPADWLAFRASLHSNRSVEKIKGSLWNWYAIRINYASKDNRWWNCRLTIRIKTWRVQRVKESFAGRVIPNLGKFSIDRSNRSKGLVWNREGYYEYDEKRDERRLEFGINGIFVVASCGKYRLTMGLNRDSGWSRGGHVSHHISKGMRTEYSNYDSRTHRIQREMKLEPRHATSLTNGQAE